MYREVNGEEVLVVPKLMQVDVIKRAHEQGHFGWKKTEYLLQNEFWFPRMQDKIKKIVANCVECILAEKKQGKADGFLHPIEKKAVPLDTYHVDHLGSMPSTRKSYNHIFVVVDAFTKFTWLYPTKTTTADETIAKLKLQATTFGNPRRIISDRGAAFTSNVFKEYCQAEDIEHTKITTGVPRANGQVERMNRTIIPIITKLSIDNPMDWWKHINRVQQLLNSSGNRSIKTTPFEVLMGKKMKLKDDLELRRLIEEELIDIYEEDRSAIRDEAKKNLLMIQEENKKVFNRKRKAAKKYSIGDLVAIQRTQFGTGIKVHPKFLGPYKITAVKGHDRYDVEKIGNYEGPKCTSTAADHMKPWVKEVEHFSDDNEE